MQIEAKVTSKGQITLPARLREALGVSSGDHVLFRETDSGTFELVAKRHSLADLRGAAKLERPISPQELDAWIADARASAASEAE